jgi:hypothetical protein
VGARRALSLIGLASLVLRSKLDPHQREKSPSRVLADRGV